VLVSVGVETKKLSNLKFKETDVSVEYLIVLTRSTGRVADNTQENLSESIETLSILINTSVPETVKKGLIVSTKSENESEFDDAEIIVEI
jgi:hypothetical protein